MNFYFIDDLIRLLKQIPLLQDADVNSAYAAPAMSRPVLRKTVSVGLQSAQATPASRTTYQAQAEVFLALLFPCGMGPSSLSDCVEDICQRFTGQVLQYYRIARITVGRAKFDATAYAIRAEMIFHLTGQFESAVNQQDPPTRVRFGTYTFEETPDEIQLEQEVEGLQADGTLPSDRSVPVTITLRGDCMYDADSGLCQNLQKIYTLPEKNLLTLPYHGSFETVPVRLSIKNGADGAGFSYEAVFREWIPDLPQEGTA